MIRRTGARISSLPRSIASKSLSTKTSTYTNKLRSGNHFRSNKVFSSTKNTQAKLYFSTGQKRYPFLSTKSLVALPPREPLKALPKGDGSRQIVKKEEPYTTTYPDSSKKRIQLVDDSFSYTLFIDERGKTRRVDEEPRSKVIPSIDEKTYKHSGSGTPLTLPGDLKPSTRDIYSKEPVREEDVKSVFGGKYREGMAQKVVLNGKEHPCGFVWYGTFHPSMRPVIEALGQLYTKHEIPADRRISNMPFYHYKDVREMFVVCTPHMNATHIREAAALAKEMAHKLYDDPNVDGVVMQTYLSVMRWDGHPTLPNSGDASHARSAIVAVLKDGSRLMIGALESTGALNHPEKGKRTHSPSSESSRLPTDYAVDRTVTKEGEDYSMLTPRVPGSSAEIKNMTYFSEDMHTQLPEGGWYSDSIVKEIPLSRESLEDILATAYLIKIGSCRIYGDEIENPNKKFSDTVPFVRKMSHPSLGPHGQGSGAFNCITLAFYLETLVRNRNAGGTDFSFKDFPAMGSTNETFAQVLMSGAEEESRFFDTKGNEVPREKRESFLGDGIRQYLDARNNKSPSGGLDGIKVEKSREGVDRIINWTKPRSQPKEVANTFFQWDGKKVPDERVLETMRDYVKDAAHIAKFSTEEVNWLLSLFPKPEDGSS